MACDFSSNFQGDREQPPSPATLGTELDSEGQQPAASQLSNVPAEKSLLASIDESASIELGRLVGVMLTVC